MGRRAHNEGTVYFDQARGRWVGQAPPERNYRTGKVRRRKIIGASGESKASVAKRLRAFIEEQAPAGGAPETVGELVARWRKTLNPRDKGQSQGNIDRIDSQIRSHVRVLADVPVGSLSPDDVEAWLEGRKDKNGKLLAQSTLKKLRSILAQAYDYGMKRQYVRWNPARVADLPAEAAVKRQGRALTAKEAARLLDHVRGDRLGAWVVLGLTLGLRPGEISGLSWDAVDFRRRTLVVYQSLGVDGRLKGTKTGRTRTLALPDLTIEALKDHRKRQKAERDLAGDWPARYAELVFLNSYGRPLERANTRRMVRGFGEGAGIGVLNPYDLRHTAAELMSSTASEWKLADLLGHADTETVQRHYRHPETSVIHVADEYWRQGAFQGANKSGKRKSG